MQSLKKAQKRNGLYKIKMPIDLINDRNNFYNYGKIRKKYSVILFIRDKFSFAIVKISIKIEQ